MDLRETYNKIAKDWAEEHGGITWSTPRMMQFATFLKPGSFILDVGCASGTKARELTALDMRVHGIDLSEEMITIAKQTSPHSTFEVMDIRDLRLIDSYDAILAVAIFLHLPKTEVPGVVKQLWDKLKPGGHFYVAVKERRADEPQEKIVEQNNYGYDYVRYYSFFTMAELKGYFEALGAEIMMEERFPTGSTVWLNIIVRKP